MAACTKGDPDQSTDDSASEEMGEETDEEIENGAEWCLVNEDSEGEYEVDEEQKEVDSDSEDTSNIGEEDDDETGSLPPSPPSLSSSSSSSSTTTTNAAASTNQNKLDELPRYYNIENWTWIPSPSFPQKPAINHQPGLVPGVWENREHQTDKLGGSAREYHCLFWPEERYIYMADRTNDYAAAQLGAGGALSKTSLRFTPTDKSEMKAFHAVLMIMSIKKNQEGVQSYWFDEPWGDPWIQSIFTYDRFKKLLRFLHVYNPDKDFRKGIDDPSDPTLKVKKMYEMCNQRTSEVVMADQKICIDESMFKVTSNRNPIRQLNTAKPIPAGCKAFTMVDNNGIILWSMLYRGRRGVNEPEVGVALNVVKMALKQLRTKGHQFTTDNWYGSYAALEEFKAAGHCCLLMMRRPRKLKAGSTAGANSALHVLGDIITTKCWRGTSDKCYLKGSDGETRAMLQFWRDNKVVVLLTDAYSGQDDDGTVVTRQGKGEPTGLQVSATQAVLAYNMDKSAVDRHNHLRSQCDVQTTFDRWWVRPFINGPLVDMVVNAWQTTKIRASRKLSFAQFQRELAMELLMDHMALKVRRHVKIEYQPLPAGHNLTKLTSAAGDKRVVCFICKGHSHCGYYCSGCHLAVHKHCFGKLKH